MLNTCIAILRECHRTTAHTLHHSLEDGPQTNGQAGEVDSTKRRRRGLRHQIWANSRSQQAQHALRSIRKCRIHGTRTGHRSFFDAARLKTLA